MRRGSAELLALLLIACGGEASEPSPPPVVAPPIVTPPVPVEPPPPPPPDSRIEPLGPYLADVGRDCDGFPFLPLTTPPGICVGLVLTTEHPVIAGAESRFRPRTLVEHPTDDGVFFVVDPRNRRPGAGAVYRLDARTRPVSLERVIDGLSRPHGSAIGPDGRLWIGEVDRIVSYDPTAADVAASRQIVIDALPSRMSFRDRLRFHPLKAFVFASDGDLVVNMGSSTDHCDESRGEPACHDEAEHLAGIWRFEHAVVEGRHTWSTTPTYVALGLRNSVALVAHSSGTILQGENAVDFPETDRPHEELNVIVEGRHYGWPYCYDMHEPDPRWASAGFSCDASNPRYEPPHLLLPPHGAPLGMVYYESETLPGLRGHLIVGLHGYRGPGHRVLAYAVDARGLPAPDAAPIELVAGWDATETSPRGAPVGITVARDGSIWTVEDTNRTVLRIARDRWASSRSGAVAPSGPEVIDDPRFASLHHDVLVPRCAHCHDPLAGDAGHALAAITREGWLREEDGATLLWSRVRPEASPRMPLDGSLTRAETDAISAWLDAR